MYLIKAINKLFRMYSKSFGKIGLSLLQNLAKNDYEIDYKKFSYKI